MHSLIINLWNKAHLNAKIASSIVIFFIFWMLTGAVSCSEDVVEAPKKITKTVAIQQFISSEFTPQLELIALTEAENAIVISAEIHGHVIEKVSDGSIVKKGDSLLKLSIDTLNNQLLASEAHLEEAKERYKSAKQLKKEGFKASTDLAAKKATLEDAKLAVKAVKVDLERINIAAPMDGKVDRIYPEIGEYVTNGTNIIKFIGAGKRKLSAHIAQKQRYLAKVGSPISAKLVDGTAVTGVIESIALEASELTKTYRVTAILDDDFNDIPLGMTARLNIPTDKVMAYNIPHSSLVLDSDGEIGVIVTKNKIAHFTNITILQDSQNGVWINGIDESQANIVIRGQTAIIDGENINPIIEIIKG